MPAIRRMHLFMSINSVTTLAREVGMMLYNDSKDKLTGHSFGASQLFQKEANKNFRESIPILG